MKNILFVLLLVFLIPSCKESKPPVQNNNEAARNILKKYYIRGVQKGYEENNNTLTEQDIKRILQEEFDNSPLLQ